MNGPADSPGGRVTREPGGSSPALIILGIIVVLAAVISPVSGDVVPSGITGWGSNGFGTKNISSGTDFVAVSAGSFHNIALTANGSIAGWGSNTSGQHANMPAGTGYHGIAAGSDANLALTADGRIVAWGVTPSWFLAGMPADAGYTAVATNGIRSLALRENGSIVAWGSPVPTPPAGTGYTAIAVGGSHYLALTANGTIVQWGDTLNGQGTPPPGTGYRAIRARGQHSLALTANGSLVQWGDISGPPAPGDGYTAIALGIYHGMALAANGSIVQWGSFDIGTPPSGTGYQAIASGDWHGIAVKPVLTTTNLTSFPDNTTGYGTEIALAATVTSAVPGAGTPSGNVTFLDGTVPFGSAPLNATGVAVFSTATLVPGTHSLAARYDGDMTFGGSTSAVLVQSVDKGTSDVTVTGPSAATEGIPVSMTAHVAALAPAPGFPAGTVQFRDYDNPLGVSVSCTDGYAWYNGTLVPGTHEITAEYFGDSNFTGSTSLVPAIVNVSHAPAVVDISPRSGFRGKKVRLAVTGTYFQANATVRLAKGASVIRGVTKNVTVPSGIVASVKIPGKAGTGKWNLVVTNPDGGNATRRKAFTVR